MLDEPETFRANKIVTLFKHGRERNGKYVRVEIFPGLVHTINDAEMESTLFSAHGFTSKN